MEQQWNDRQEKTEGLLRKLYPSVILSTVTPMWTHLGANSGLCGKESAIRRGPQKQDTNYLNCSFEKKSLSVPHTGKVSVVVKMQTCILEVQFSNFGSDTFILGSFVFLLSLIKERVQNRCVSPYLFNAQVIFPCHMPVYKACNERLASFIVCLMVSSLGPGKAISSSAFRGLLQSLQKNTGIVLQSRP